MRPVWVGWVSGRPDNKSWTSLYTTTHVGGVFRRRHPKNTVF